MQEMQERQRPYQAMMSSPFQLQKELHSADYLQDQIA